MIKQLAHICIYSLDLDATEAFYCEVLGLEMGFTFMKAETRIGYYLKAGQNTFIEVFKGEPGEVGNINHVAIEVSDLDQIITTLRRHGYEVGDKKLGSDASWQAWTRDPNGIRIEFHEYTPESMQLRGGVCKVSW